MRKTSALLVFLVLLTACTPARVVTKTGTTAIKVTGSAAVGVGKAAF